MVWAWVFLALIVPRLVLAIWWPAGGGDSAVYATVAENILLNKCVSLSPPGAGECVLHWGGNQLPGYPAFLAAVWAISHNNTAVLLVQSALVPLAVVWLGYCASPLTNRTTGAALAAIVGLSPLTLAWSRFLLTDALSVAATLCLLAEVFHCWHGGKVRVLPLAAALSVAIFLRYDNVLLVFLLVPLLWQQRAAAVVALGLALIPLGGWWARSVEAGLGWHPPVGAMPDGGRAPRGYIAWGNGWMTDQYEYRGWFYPVAGRRYSEIVIPARALATGADRVRNLVAQMAAYDGAELPQELDDEFGALAQPQWKLVPIRLWNMWFSPFNSSGWPVSVVPAAGQTWRDLAADNLVPAAVKLGTAVWRLALIPVAIGLAWWASGWRRSLLLLASAYALLQSAAHAGFGFIDTRYLLGPVSILEASVALALLPHVKRPGRHPLQSSASST